MDTERFIPFRKDLTNVPDMEYSEEDIAKFVRRGADGLWDGTGASIPHCTQALDIVHRVRDLYLQEWQTKIKERLVIKETEFRYNIYMELKYEDS